MPTFTLLYRVLLLEGEERRARLVSSTRDATPEGNLGRARAKTHSCESTGKPVHPIMRSVSSEKTLTGFFGVPMYGTCRSVSLAYGIIRGERVRPCDMSTDNRGSAGLRRLRTHVQRRHVERVLAPHLCEQLHSLQTGRLLKVRRDASNWESQVRGRRQREGRERGRP